MASVNWDAIQRVNAQNVSTQPVDEMPFYPPAESRPTAPLETAPTKPYNPTDPHPVLTPYPINPNPPLGSSGPGGIDLNTGRPLMTPAPSQPALSGSLQATSAPSSYYAPPADPQIAQLVASYIQSQGLRGNQSDPSALMQIVSHLRAQGINAQVDYTDENGHTGGILVDGHPYQLLDGSNNWTALQPWQESGGGSGSGAGAGYTDPSSQLFINELLSRMQSLRQPVNDPMAPLYQLQALSRVQNLAQAPYTGADDAALVAKYMNPLTQARDAALQQNKERIGARGMLPTSGLLDELNKGTNASYQQGVAYGSNDLAVRAVDERQRRQQEQLSVLSDLLNLGKSQRSEENARGQEIVNLASQLPAMDERRLAALLQASGDNAPAANASSNLLNQGSQNLSQQLLHANDQASRDSAWGEFFGMLLNNWGQVFG